MKFFKDTRIAPSAESAVDAIPIPVDFWQCPPGGAFFGHPENSRKKASTVFGFTDIDVLSGFEKREDALPRGIRDRHG